jgi:uncharacterized protein (DUF433 family)
MRSDFRLTTLPIATERAGRQYMANPLERITSDPEICGGRPCIRGLRVRVKDILEMLVGGSTRAEILGDAI